MITQGSGIKRDTVHRGVGVSVAVAATETAKSRRRSSSARRAPVGEISFRPIGLAPRILGLMRAVARISASLPIWGRQAASLRISSQISLASDAICLHQHWQGVPAKIRRAGPSADPPRTALRPRRRTGRGSSAVSGTSHRSSWWPPRRFRAACRPAARTTARWPHPPRARSRGAGAGCPDWTAPPCRPS